MEYESYPKQADSIDSIRAVPVKIDLSSYMGLLNAIGDGLSIQDKNFRVIYQNETHKEIIGDHKGEFCYKAYEGRDEICEGCPLLKSFGDGGVYTAEREGEGLQGKVCVEITSSVLRDDSGEIAAGIEIIRNITGRKRMEKNLQETNANFQALIEAMPDLVFFKDLKGTHLIVNRATELFIGRPRQEILNKTTDEVLPPEVAAVCWENDRKVMHNGLTLHIEESFRNKDGESKVFDTIKAPILDANEKIIGLVGVCRDITRKKEIERELEEYRHELEKLVARRTKELEMSNEKLIREMEEKNRLQGIAQAIDTMNNVGYIFSGIRHELGNPINSIKANLNLLKRELEHGGPDSPRKYVERAITELARIEYLLQNLKSYNIYENPEIRALDMNAFLRDFISLVKEDLANKGIKMKLEASDCSCAMADPRALHQVLLNIITNASDALAGREGPRIDISLSRLRKDLRIRVLDNGHGIPSKHISSLFQPFFTTKQTGTGLGLVLARKLVLKMNGYMEVESKEGEGTAVDIYLNSCPQPGE
jgi:PAS domain S-box-containing protein